MSLRRISRRKFFRAAAGSVAAAGVTAHTTILKPRVLEAASRAVAPSDQIGIGIIGVGMQGAVSCDGR